MPEEKGFVFVNAVLCDVPGLNASWRHGLDHGDHVGIFSLGYMWPYQYRDGAHMSEALKEMLRAQGAMHHSYTAGEAGMSRETGGAQMARKILRIDMTNRKAAYEPVPEKLGAMGREGFDFGDHRG